MWTALVFLKFTISEVTYSGILNSKEAATFDTRLIIRTLILYQTTEISFS